MWYWQMKSWCKMEENKMVAIFFKTTLPSILKLYSWLEINHSSFFYTIIVVQCIRPSFNLHFVTSFIHEAVNVNQVHVNISTNWIFCNKNKVNFLQCKRKKNLCSIYMSRVILICRFFLRIILQPISTLTGSSSQQLRLTSAWILIGTSLNYI